MKRCELILMMALFSVIGMAQERDPGANSTTLFGYAYDQYDGFPVQGAWVVLDGTPYSAYTDSWGHYEIPEVPVVPLIADFSADVTSGPGPLEVHFSAEIAGGSPLMKMIHDEYDTWMEGRIEMNINGLTHVDGTLHPLGKMRISAEWAYYQYLNTVTAFLKTPFIGSQSYELNSLNPLGSLSEPPYSLFRTVDTEAGKIIYLTFSDFSEGTYRYFLNVDKFGIGNGYDIPTIRIFNEDSLVHCLNGPVSGEGNWWYVCDIHGSDGNINLVNQWQADPPPAGRNMPSGEIKAVSVFPVMDGNRSYQWDFGDGSSSNEKTPVHVFTDAGMYTVTLVISDGVNQATETKENYIQVGGQGFGEHSALKCSVFPNPASAKVKIRFDDADFLQAGLIFWQMMDPRGQIVMGGVGCFQQDHVLSIDVSSLTGGLYCIWVSDHEGRTGAGKFIRK